MDNEKEISFGAFDSELMHQEIFIPEGFTATIDGNKIILTRIENEDERVRKALITYFQGFPYNGIEKAGTNSKEAIAWLKKQGNQKSKKVSIWKHWKDGICGNGEGKLIYLIKNGDAYSLSSSLGFECDYIDLSELDNLMLEKQGEKKCFLNPSNDKDIRSFVQEIKRLAKAYDLNLPNRSYDIYAFAKDLLDYLEKQSEQKLPIEKLPSEMKTIEESLGFTTQKECDEYNQMVSGLIMSDDNKEEQKQNVDNKKLTDVNHEYFSELLENDDSKDINDYAYQVAYCMSHDWLEETATWEDVQKAVKLGAEWQKQKSTVWSEEDEVKINRIVACLENLNVADNDILLKDVDWLKSLKYRYAWKPSDEQINALEYYIYSNSPTATITKGTIFGNTIVELLEQLKKLKEE